MAEKSSEINQYSKLGLIAKQLVDGFITGLHQSPYHGFSVEFAEHKLYNYGESTRHIDWKVYARTDKLFTKRYQEETNLRCHILIDNSGSMHYPQPDKGKLKFSIYGASALAHLLIKQRDMVGLKVFSDSFENETRQRNTQSHLTQILAMLANLSDHSPKVSESDISGVISEIAEKISKRSLVIIFSDMFQNASTHVSIFNALQHLRHKKHEVILFHVTDNQSEVDFSFEDRPYKFIDLESRESIKVNPYEIKEQYKEQMNEFLHSLKIKCGGLKIDFIPVDISESHDKILGSYLIKRKKMM